MTSLPLSSKPMNLRFHVNLTIMTLHSAKDRFRNLLRDPIPTFLYYNPYQEPENQNEDANQITASRMHGFAVVASEKRYAVVTGHRDCGSWNGIDQYYDDDYDNICILNQVIACDWRDQTACVPVGDQPEPEEVKAIYAAEAPGGVAMHLFSSLGDKGTDERCCDDRRSCPSSEILRQEAA